MPRHVAPVTTVTMRPVTDAAADRALKVLVYSDDVNTRQQVILALGRRPHPDLPELEYVEVATEPVVIQNMDAGTIDLAILDGEAVPAGRRADRPPAGRLAGHLVPGRGRRPAPAGPDPAGRDGRVAAALARARE